LNVCREHIQIEIARGEIYIARIANRIMATATAETRDSCDRIAPGFIERISCMRPSRMPWLDFTLTATSRQLAGSLAHAPVSVIEQPRDIKASLQTVNGRALRTHLRGDILINPIDPDTMFCWTDDGACKCTRYGSRFLLPESIVIPRDFDPLYFHMFNCAFTLQIDDEIRAQLRASFIYAYSDPRWYLGGERIARASFAFAGKKYVIAWPPTVTARDAMSELASSRALIVYVHIAGILMRYFA